MFNRSTIFGIVWIALLADSPVSRSADLVLFDLPPTAAAVSVVDPSEITFSLRLSSMVQSPSMPRIDQWIVTCRPRGEGVSVVDYSPRTETASDLSTPIKVKRSKEKTRSFGLDLDGAYGSIADANATAENGETNTESVQFDQTAPVQAVTAAGTIDRGRGVYFKLRWTATQVLEGEKLFRVTLRVPEGWRGSLMDVSVRADRNEKKFGGLDEETVTVGAADFVVATYRSGDIESQTRAIELAEAEYELRNLAKSVEHRASIRSLPQMLRYVVAKIDGDSPSNDNRWIGRLISGRADPHLDKSIRRLPMSLRIAALDYAGCRDDFTELSQAGHGSIQRTCNREDHVLVAKPILRTQ